jgi:hypothetical protein
MKTTCTALGIMLVLALVGAAGQTGSAREGKKLELPKGWRSEDGPYPPQWARQLPWRGDLEIRFPPGWFNAKSPYFWSYPVLYHLDGDILASGEDLVKALRAYDGGLYRGQFAADKIQIDMGKEGEVQKQGHSAIRRSVTLKGFDPFTTRRELTTYLEVFRWYCPESNKTEVLLLRSPRTFNEDDDVWKALLPFWDKFTCHANKGA